jgi:ArsR family transcriptional regulator
MLSYTESAILFKALSDETRLKIVDMLSCGELCACDILEEFAITQPTLSYHMKMMTESGLVNGRKDGAWMRYTLNEPKLATLKDFLEEITVAKENCVCNKTDCSCSRNR